MDEFEAAYDITSISFTLLENVCKKGQLFKTQQYFQVLAYSICLKFII